jgi:hypothetical protein
VHAQRSVDGVEVGPQFGRRAIWRQAQVKFVLRLMIQDLGRGCGKPAADRAQGTAVRLVEVDGIGASVGQRGHIGGHGDQPRRHRQLLLEGREFGEVARQRGECGADGCQPDHVGGHVRISVAIAPDPRAGPQNGLGKQIRV